MIGHLPACEPVPGVYALGDRGTAFIKAACVVSGEAGSIGSPAIRTIGEPVEKFPSASDALERVHFGAQFREETNDNVIVRQLNRRKYYL